MTYENRQQHGQWYFYNPTAVSQGKITFQQQWGKRENTDNWQRTNQTVVNLNGNNPDNQEEQGKSGNQDHQGNQDHLGNQDDQENQGGEDILAPNDSIAADPHQREYYLAQIPFTEEQQAASHQLIKDALFHAGIILKDKIDNLELSEAYLLRLTENYDDFEHLDEAWYHLFLLYSRQGDVRQAENCLNRLKADYPESEWTILLSDPYYAENARFGEHIEDSLYAATYEAFKADRADIIKANAQLSESRFPSGANRDKFIFIDGLSHLNEGDGDGCMERLQVVVEKYPDSEVSPLAGMIIKGVQEGRKLHGGKFDIGDVWTRRDITLTRDSTVSDTLSADRNQEYLFMLIYEPDSVNENQLLFEMAKYNFTNFLVRNFEIQLDEDNGLHRMTISGFLSYDEALQYARQLYQNETLTERIKPCRNLIISKANLALIGRQFSYDDYQLFYEETLQPMPISKEKLLIIPEEMEQPDIEDIGKDQDTEEEEEKEDEFMPANKQQKQQVKDFDFGDDFW